MELWLEQRHSVNMDRYIIPIFCASIALLALALFLGRVDVSKMLPVVFLVILAVLAVFRKKKNR